MTHYLSKKKSLDSIVCSVCEGMPRVDYENNLESIEMFIDSANVNFQRTELSSIIEKDKYKVYVTKYPESKPTTVIMKENERLIIYGVSFENKIITDESTYIVNHSFEFVKIDGRFRFYSMESRWSSRWDNKR